jgi:hypothetical protein
MKTIPVNVSQTDYQWLKIQAEQRNMTIPQIIEEMISDASALDAIRINSVAHLQAFLKEPPALTPEEAAMLDRIIQMSREGKVIPPEVLRGHHESPTGNHSD